MNENPSKKKKAVKAPARPKKAAPPAARPKPKKAAKKAVKAPKRPSATTVGARRKTAPKAKKKAIKKAPAKKAAAKKGRRAPSAPVPAKKAARKRSSSVKAKRPQAPLPPPEADDSASWAHHAAPKKHGIDPTVKRGRDEVVYLSPKTRKPLARVRKGQQILFGHVTASGDVHVLHEHAQPADDVLRAWIEKTLRTRPKAVLFLQQAKETLRPGGEYKLKKHEKLIRGVLHRKKPRSTKWEPVHGTRLARPTVSKKQQAVRYERGRQRPLEGGRIFHQREEIDSLRTPTWAPTGRTLDIPVTGATIYDSLKSVVLDKALKRMRPWQEVYYQYVVVYRDPRTGEKTTIPGRGKHLGAHVSATPADFPGMEPGSMVAQERLSRAAFSPAAQIARSIRLSLAENGLRFSSLYTLDQIQQDMEGRIDKETAKGNTKRAGQLARGLVGLEYLHAVQYGGRVTRGTKMASMIPLRPERADGRVYKNIPGALTVKLRLTIVDDPRKKMEWEEKQEEKRAARRDKPKRARKK